MPQSPGKYCTHPGCRTLVKSGRCDVHRKQGHKRYDETRGNSGQRGYDARWQKVREIHLDDNPLCEMCLKDKVMTPAAVVHHIRPIEEAPGLRLDYDNLMSLCVAHHEEIHDKWHGSCRVKTKQKGGGWGA